MAGFGGIGFCCCGGGGDPDGCITCSGPRDIAGCNWENVSLQWEFSGSGDGSACTGCDALDGVYVIDYDGPLTSGCVSPGLPDAPIVGSSPCEGDIDPTVRMGWSFSSINCDPGDSLNGSRVFSIRLELFMPDAVPGLGDCSYLFGRDLAEGDPDYNCQALRDGITLPRLFGGGTFCCSPPASANLKFVTT